MKSLNVPAKERISEKYKSYSPLFTEILANIKNKLETSITLASKPTYKARIKSFQSYYKKILRQKPVEAQESDQLVTLTDMMGIRVICAFLEDLAEVEKQISNMFDVKEVERKGANQSFREFGYESVHILVAIPESCIPKDNTMPLPDNLVCEIQVRTILQDAWAEVEHELVYKSEFNPFDKPLRRKLASINASLTLADMVFQEIRDYQNKLQAELGTRRNTFYEKADSITDMELGLTEESKNSAMTKDQLDLSAISRMSIDDMVLLALHEHNQGNFDNATKIYTLILESEPEPNDIIKSVILKHRGMANFAQNKYEVALGDFMASEKFDPKGFRTIYYEGIVYSVQQKYQEAIECYDRSLSIDKYQSHVYYRRALAYYEIGDYSKAMEDVESASNLGLKDQDLDVLKGKLLKKFDMNM